MMSQATMKIRFACILGAMAMLALSYGCGKPAPENAAPNPPEAKVRPREGKLKITTTIGMIADVAKNIGGEWVEVESLMGAGVDPHLYKATKGDLDRLSAADLIFYNGLHLEGKMGDVLVRMASRVRTVAVTDNIPETMRREPPEFAGQYDPHVWFDVKLWALTAQQIRNSLVEADPAHAEDFKKNAEAYLMKMRELDDYARAQIATIPKEQRVLVTAHDAFGYFGKAYDIEVTGLQGVSTASEYGLQDLERLTDMIVARKIKAVFVESSVPRKSIEALVRGVEAKGHTVTIGGELFSDAMGAEGTPEGTYLGMVKHNVDTIVKALK